MSGNRHLRILGQDDRLLYARTATGVLVYTAIDTDWHWLEAPHEGQAKHGSPEWREDGQFMHDWVSSHPEDYDWQVCDTEPWPPEADEAFVPLWTWRTCGPIRAPAADRTRRSSPARPRPLVRVRQHPGLSLKNRSCRAPL